MGKVVLIEPHKVLQQAIALSLFPEHEVRVEESLAAAAVSELGEVDLLIVDAAALGEKNLLPAELVSAIGRSPIPTMWIDEKDSARAPKRKKLAVVGKPIESAALQTAVADLLSPGSEKGRKTPVAAEPEAAKSRAAEKKAGAESGDTAGEPIELVEIVEEEAPASGRRAAPKKNK